MIVKPLIRRKAYTVWIHRAFATAEQQGVRVGLVTVIATFSLYMLHLPPPYLAVEELLGLLDESASAFVVHQNMPTGWGWMRLLGFSDMMARAKRDRSAHPRCCLPKPPKTPG